MPLLIEYNHNNVFFFFQFCDHVALMVIFYNIFSNIKNIKI
jgi:hypothetical protein